MAQDALSEKTIAAGAKMLALARDRSIPGREALASSVSEMVANRGEDFNESEEQLASDILRTLIRDVERSVSAALAVNLAATAAAPRDVILALANDDIEVAFPVLSESPLLEDDDLTAIISGRATGHRIAVAMRPGLSAHVADALVKCADMEAIVCLLHNHEATIAEATFASLIPKAPAANPYKVPLAGREDLPRDIALRLAATLSKRFQDQLIGRYKLDPAAVRTAGAHATNDAMEDLTSEGEDSDDEFADRRRDVRQMIEMLRRGEWPHFEAAMVRFTRLTPRLIHSVLREHDGRQLTVLCRACGIHKSDFASLYLLSRRATPDVEVVDANDVRDALVLFDKIAKPAAERAIRRWRAVTPKRNSGLH